MQSMKQFCDEILRDLWVFVSESRGAVLFQSWPWLFENQRSVTSSRMRRKFAETLSTVEVNTTHTHIITHTDAHEANMLNYICISYDSCMPMSQSISGGFCLADAAICTYNCACTQDLNVHGIQLTKINRLIDKIDRSDVHRLD